MNSGKDSNYQAEWTVLQNQYDNYEKWSLLIKLTSVVVTALLLAVFHAGLWAAIFASVLWLQDGIWKTYQSRINSRLLDVEAALNGTVPGAAGPMQYNQCWLAARPGVTGLVKEYLCSALAPTVAYPHVVLVGMGLLVGGWGV